MANWWEAWDPDNVTLTADTPGDAWKTCVIQGVYFGDNEYNGNLGGRISAIFVIFVTSLVVTLFPVIARRVKWLNIPEIVYTTAKMFGSGVIIATAFIHLMDPAYSEIGGQSCVGMTGNWAIYSWCPAIMLAMATFVFLVDTYCDYFADVWYGTHSHAANFSDINGGDNDHVHAHDHSHPEHHHFNQRWDAENVPADAVGAVNFTVEDDDGSIHSGAIVKKKDGEVDVTSVSTDDVDYYSQFAGFLVLEFGILFHSVMIGLTLGSAEDYSTLYPVLVFHQAFEGLGIGARMSAIPFPHNRIWVPYVLGLAYSLTTPISIAIGLGVRTTYRDSGYNAQIVSGVLDAMSAGVLLYTGFVELLARDFIFNPHRTKNIWMLNYQLFLFLWGAGLMALLGKWA